MRGPRRVLSLLARLRGLWRPLTADQADLLLRVKPPCC